MLTRSSAEGAAAAAAAVVASAAPVASEAARNLDGRRRVGRYTREGNGVLHQSHRIVSRFRPLLLRLARMAPVRVGRARVCFAGRHRPARLMPSKPLAASDTSRGGDDRGSGSRGTLGRLWALLSPERLQGSNSLSYVYDGAVVARRSTTVVCFLQLFIWGVGRGAVVDRRSATRASTRIPFLMPRSQSIV